MFLPADEKARLDLILKSCLQHVSRSKIQTLIESGVVLLKHQQPKKPGILVSRGDLVEINDFPFFEDKRPLVGRKQNLKIIYEDEDLLVLNKDAGVTMHPGAGTEDNTLVHGLISHCGSNLSSLGGSTRPGIVHRLDKDTSGLVAIAKTDLMYANLAEQLADRTMQRLYLVWVWGIPNPSCGTINVPVRRNSANRERICVHPEGKEAKTDYKTLKSTGVASLLQCKLLTGRTHQIRVHMLHLGHPVIGDKTYRRKKIKDDFGRQALHAYQLKLLHFRKREEMFFRAPIPEDLQSLSLKMNLSPKRNLQTDK